MEFVSRLRPLTKVNLSKTGVDVFFDSYTAITLTASGVLSDISSSSTLKPYLLSSKRLLFSVDIPVLRVTSIVWLLLNILLLLVNPNFLRVTFTVALPEVSFNPLNVISFPPFVIVTWSDVKGSVDPSG